MVCLLLTAAASCSDALAAPRPEGAPLAAAGPVRDAQAAHRAVEQLAWALETEHPVRADWDRAAGAAAIDLDRSQRPDLLGILARAEATPLERVAAAELFRRLPPGAGAPGAADLARLRRDAFGGLPGTPLAGAARRALVELGDWSDRLRLVRELATTAEPEVRLTAAWCLESVRTCELLPDLAQVLEPGSAPQAAELGAAVLERIVRTAAPLEEDLRAELVERALTALDAPFCPPEVEARVAGLLGALDDARARARLELLVREGREPAARALATSAAGRERLAAVARDPRAGDGARLRAAAALAGSEPDGSAGSQAVDELCRVAEHGLEERWRRDAVLALGRLPSEAARRALERVHARDPEADLRALAAGLLAPPAEP